MSDRRRNAATTSGPAGETAAATRIGRTAAWLAALSGWRRFLVALALGALGPAALPPSPLFFLLVPSFTGLIWMLNGARGPWQAARIGWAFGVGYFAVGLYWVTQAFLVDIQRWGVLALPALLCLSAGLALFPALAMGLYARLRGVLAGGDGWRRVLLFAVLWVVVEWLRGHILTGFPWNLVGMAWLSVPAVAQAASVVGVYGLSLLAVVVAAMPSALAAPSRGRRPRRGALAAVTVATVVALAIGIAGGLRMASHPTETVEDVTLRLVQANIDQRDKWRTERREGNLARYVALSTGPGSEDVTHVLWPETAVPFYLANDAEHRAIAARAAPVDGLLITGSLRAERAADGAVRVFNSVLAIDRHGRITGVYDKAHLVPFGEYVPLKGLLPIRKLTAGMQDLTAGDGPRTLHLAGVPPVSPLICYEAIFPSAVAENAGDARPGWLFNVSNDGWFGRTGGPHQHFASARLRAIEEGVPMVRAANTGISGVIDPVGRVIARIDLHAEGVIDSLLPRAIARPTLYARFGDFGLFLLLAGVLVPLIARRRS